jgi:hypothetical protein
MKTNVSVVSLEDRCRGKNNQKFLIALDCLEIRYVLFFKCSPLLQRDFEVYIRQVIYIHTHGIYNSPSLFYGHSCSFPVHLFCILFL